MTDRQLVDDVTAALAPPEWTPEMKKLANDEGWGIFDCTGSAGGPWQLQKIDEDAIIPDDEAAWRLVVNSNVPHHRAAVEFLRIHNPLEYNTIMKALNVKA